jgi:NADPH-dependent glutamate synthase beta subunit-like oxidoreductase
MKSFIHHNAKSVKEAVKLLAKNKGKAKAYAGGTDLIGILKDNVVPDYPEEMINLKTIEGLDLIKEDKNGISIGALTRLSDIAGSPVIKKNYKLLADAAKAVATPNIRNMATIGGNLAQDVRCWYYRYSEQIGGPIICLRKDGKVCSALSGDNRYHSIFGAAPLTSYPCSSHCPAGTNIPLYISKVREGDLVEAAGILMDYNPIAAVTGRICPIYCEPECNRREFDEPVSIRCIERAVGDYIMENTNKFFASPKTETGKHIAIVGSGPAGLSAAFYLRRAGNKVTVYEKQEEAGGMLRYSIPPYRLPKDKVKKQIRALESMGIKFELGVEAGKKKGTSIADLKHKFDAVFLATGTWDGIKAGVPGEKAEGVIYAIDYLFKINSGKKVSLGKKVVVVGGGSVAVDAARTAKRQGVGEVHLLCLECRDFNSKDKMLAQEIEVTDAEEEGVIVHNSLGVREILTKGGKVTGLDTVTCMSVREPDGKFNPKYDNTCSALSLVADTVILAIGQTAGKSLKATGFKYSKKGTISINEKTSETGVKGVFAGGDSVIGPSTVIQAVASGKKAAEQIEIYLNKGKKKSVKSSGGSRTETGFVNFSIEMIPRVKLRTLPAAERVKSIDAEDALDLKAEEITTEAQRCFNCGCLAVAPSDIGTALVALKADIITSKRTIDAETFFSTTASSSNILDPEEIITDIRIPKPQDGVTQNYIKFTLRKPVDFSLVSTASAIAKEDGICTDARIVIGGVAPSPIRALKAEEYLKGKKINEALAVKAGELAVENALPLAGNSYKVQIAKTLVKRVILGD